MSFFRIGQKLEMVIGKEQELLDASRNGNLEAVEKLLANKSKKSTGGAIGQKLTSFLKNVNVNYTDKNGYTALHHAAVNGHRDIVEALLKADAQPGGVDSQGCTPVHLAAWNGNAEIVMQLLTAGNQNSESEGASSITPVNVNHQNGNGNTALHCAAQYGHVPVVDVLLQKHANPTIRNLNEESALDLAAQYGRLEVVQLLLTLYPDLSQRPACTQSTVHLASRNGHKEIVEVLLNSNFDVQTVTEMGSALHEAALHGKLEVVKLLLDHGIDINLCDREGRTALQLLSAHQAQQKSFTEITQAIKDHVMKGNHSDLELYDRLSNYNSNPVVDKPMATVRPLTPDKPDQTDKPVIKTPDKPSPAPRASRIYPPPPPSEDRPPTPPYSKPNKEKSGNPERVASTVSCIGDTDSPPPLPPRISMYTQEDRTAGKESESPKKEGSPKQMVVPKKPPRQKKSPAPARRSTDTKQIPSPDSSPVLPKPPSTIPETPVNIPVVSVKTVVPSQHSSVSVDQSEQSYNSSQKLPEQTDQVDSSASLKGQSEVKESPNKPAISPKKPSLSPKPALPPRSNIVSSVQEDCEQKETGIEENQTVYVEMKPKPTPRGKSDSNEVESKDSTNDESNTKLKTAEIKVDNYGILFPNLKNSLPSKSKHPPITRSNTAPDESVYVGPSPLSPAAKFKEKHGQLRRINTAPDDPTYTAMTGPLSPHSLESGKENEYVGDSKENEYAEIVEKTGAPFSPVENIYATIPEVQKQEHSSVYGHISEMSSMIHSKDKEVGYSVSKGDNSKKELEMESQSDTPQIPEPDSKLKGNEKNEKPTYLDFMKKQSSHPLTPTGYPQPPTPDFPPPSPATAMLGIELKIQEMDSKRKSRDMTTITDDYLEQVSEQIKDKNKRDSSDLKVTHIVQSDRLSREVIKEEGSSESSQVSSETEISPSTAVKEGISATEEISVIESNKTKDIPKSSIPNSTVIDGEIKTKMAESQLTNQKQDETADASEPNNEDIGSSPVMMRRKSSTGTPDMDVFKGLLRGSTIGTLGKGLSLSQDEIQERSSGRPSVHSSYLTIDCLMEEEGIDVEQVMKTIDKEVAKRASASHDTSGFDDSEEWAQIADIMSSFGGDLSTSFQYSASEEERINSELEAYMDNLLSENCPGTPPTGLGMEILQHLHDKNIQDIMASFGSGIARESVFIRDFEPAFTKLIAGSMQSVGEWLESLGLGQYENAFVANGYDNVDFLDSKIMEEQDLEQIGVLNHEHRRQILLAAKSLPQLNPIDSANPPGSVEEWLMSLQLLDYLETFKSHGYDTMEKVESILWELQLRTVLDISQLGHRKRILASLGERHPPDRQNNSLKKKSLSSYSSESGSSSKQPFSDINLFRDYTNVKPTSSSEEDVKEMTQMAIDSSEEEDPITKKKSGQSIRNSNIHLRPPHLAQTRSPARQWRHKPEMLIKGCCNYTAQYLGSTIVPDLTGGTESTRGGITKLKKSTDVLAKIPVIMLSISYKGVKFIDAKSKKVICDHDIGNIFCACQDTENLNFFAYITRDIETAKHYCHVFSVKSSSLAHDIILTLGESFEVAYQMALKEKSMQEAMELDRKMSQSDNEDAISQTSRVSTNTL